MKHRSRLALRFCVVLAGAGFGCQLVSGASSLEVVDDLGPPGLEGGAGEAATKDAARADAPSDSPANDAPVDAGEDADGEAPFVACTKPTGGSFTTCRAGGLPGIASCVEYCATQRKCCAEDCAPYSTDPSVKVAQFVADTASVCIDPLSGATGSGYTACSNSPILGPEKTFKCCCR